MSKRIPASLILAFSALFALQIQAAEMNQIGTFDFPTSGSPEAQEHFLLGVGYLHSFGMTHRKKHGNIPL